MEKLTQQDLDKMCDSHEKWQSGDREGCRADFSNMDINGLRLVNRCLESAVFADTRMVGCEMTGSSFRYAFFAGANLAYAVLSRCDLRHADLSRANLAASDFTDANITGAELSGADTMCMNTTRLQRNSHETGYGADVSKKEKFKMNNPIVKVTPNNPRDDGTKLKAFINFVKESKANSRGPTRKSCFLIVEEQIRLLEPVNGERVQLFLQLDQLMTECLRASLDVGSIGYTDPMRRAEEEIKMRAKAELFQEVLAGVVATGFYLHVSC